MKFIFGWIWDWAIMGLCIFYLLFIFTNMGDGALGLEILVMMAGGFMGYFSFVFGDFIEIYKEQLLLVLLLR